MRDEYQMAPEMKEAVITLIDERIKATAVTREEYQQQTHRMDRLENALVQLADAQRHSEERQSQSVEVQRHISFQLHNLTNVVNNLSNVVGNIQQTQITMQQDIRTLKENQVAMQQTQITMQQDIRTLKENQRTLQENQVAMQQDIRTLQENQVAMQQDIRRLDNRVAKLTGDSLEERYRKHAGSYLGRVLRKVRAFKPYEMEDELRSKLSDSDYEELLPLDLLVRGIPKGHKGLHVWLAFEISAVVDRGDVERAVQRAELLRHGGYISIPAVAGERLTKGAKSLVSTQEVVVMTNGKIANFHEALARALAVKGPEVAVSSEQ